MKEPLIETFVDLSSEPTMKLLFSSPAMWVPLFLRPPDVYDSLQIIVHKMGT